MGSSNRSILPRTSYSAPRDPFRGRVRGRQQCMDRHGAQCRPVECGGASGGKDPVPHEGQRRYFTMHPGGSLPPSRSHADPAGRVPVRPQPVPGDGQGHPVRRGQTAGSSRAPLDSETELLIALPQNRQFDHIRVRDTIEVGWDEQSGICFPSADVTS